MVGNPVDHLAYFGLSHNRNKLAVDRKLITKFNASFRHALLFNRRIVLCDHMIVNSPNFRILYQTDATFRELITHEFVAVAHFELERLEKKQHMRLKELRDFYESFNLLHPKMPLTFTGSANDNELDEIEKSVLRINPKSEFRDQNFTTYANKELSKGSLKKHFGTIYGAYREAFIEMNEENPKLGIIHFDREHRFPGDKDIFDYMARLDSLSHVTSAELRTRYGSKLSDFYRALLIKAELSILDDAYTILPTELQAYSHLMWADTDKKIISNKDSEEIETPVDLSALGHRALGELSAADIRDIRKTDAGIAYFEVMEERSSLFMDVGNLSKCIEDYAAAISRHIRKKPQSVDVKKDKNEFIKIMRGKVLTKEGIETGNAAIIDLIGMASIVISSFIPASLLKNIAAKGSEKLKTIAENNEIKARYIKSNIITKESEISVQYK